MPLPVFVADRPPLLVGPAAELVFARFVVLAELVLLPVVMVVLPTFPVSD